jgi:hypothetical protein
MARARGERGIPKVLRAVAGGSAAGGGSRSWKKDHILIFVNYTERI